MKPNRLYAQAPVKPWIIWMMTNGMMPANSRRREAAALSADRVPLGG